MGAGFLIFLAGGYTYLTKQDEPKKAPSSYTPPSGAQQKGVQKQEKKEAPKEKDVPKTMAKMGGASPPKTEV
jgi:hypothetical protein